MAGWPRLTQDRGSRVKKQKPYSGLNKRTMPCILFTHLRPSTVSPRLDDPDYPVAAGLARNEAPGELLISADVELAALQGHPVVGRLDLGVVGRDDGVVAGGVVGEAEHAGRARAATAAVLLELRVDEEGREDDAEQQEDAAQDCAHVRDLVDNFEFSVFLFKLIKTIYLLTKVMMS